MREALAQAGAVFEAQVTELQPAGDELEVRLHVTRAWKAADSEDVLVRTHKDSAACGVEFVVGQSYLVYSEQSPAGTGDALRVQRCSRTQLAEAAEADFAELGLGAVPVSAREPGAIPATPAAATSSAAAADPARQERLQPAAGGCAGCSLAAQPHGSGAPLAAITASVAFAFWRRARRPRPRARDR